MPRTIDEALRIADQLETVEIAQKRLHKEKAPYLRGLSPGDGCGKLQLGVTTPPSTNTTRYGRNSEIEELTTQVRYLTKQVAQLCESELTGNDVDQSVGGAGNKAISDEIVQSSNKIISSL